MKAAINDHTKLSRYEFQFQGIETDPDLYPERSKELQRRANLRLAQLLCLAPPDATMHGVLKRSDQLYIASVEVKSRFRSFHETAAGFSPESVVHRVLEKIEDRLHRWRSGGGADGTPAVLTRRFGLTAAHG